MIASLRPRTVLLRGGLGSGSMLHPYLAEYTETRKVILIDRHGRGQQPVAEIVSNTQPISDENPNL